MDYDIGEAFQKIEEEMIASMSRNLSRHLKKEEAEGINYSMWQAEQLAALNRYRKDNREKFGGYFSTINKQIEDVLKRANESGKMTQEVQILKAIQKGWRVARHGNGVQGAFFRINDRKLDALIRATTRDMAKAEHAMLRMTDDVYRKTIYNAGVFYNTGAGTLEQCVDMATRDYLSRGINCVEYANGARVGIDTYARMALRTAQTRAYIQGESAKRDEWGVNTVIVNKRGAACPRCMQWLGRVFYDDVFGSIPVPDDKYPLLSTAIEGGLFHPNCKDSYTTFFPGINTEPKPPTKEQIEEANRVYTLEQRQNYNNRMIQKYKRLAVGSVDPENQAKYAKKAKEWEAIQRDFVHQNSDVLHLPGDKGSAEMFERYRQVLGDAAPDSLDKFEDVRYNDSEAWEKLKYRYRTVNRYEVDGKVSAEKIVELDNAAWLTKQTGFDYSAFTGHDKGKVKNLSRSGNAAVMEFDGELYFSHSQMGYGDDLCSKTYSGKFHAVGLSRDNYYQVLDLGDNIKRRFDTEVKFLEFVSKKKDPKDAFEITILSEKHICKSCEGVVEQFKKRYPNATVNIISGKRGYNGDPKGGKTWTYRKKV